MALKRLKNFKIGGAKNLSKDYTDLSLSALEAGDRGVKIIQEGLFINTFPNATPEVPFYTGSQGYSYSDSRRAEIQRVIQIKEDLYLYYYRNFHFFFKASEDYLSLESSNLNVIPSGTFSVCKLGEKDENGNELLVIFRSFRASNYTQISGQVYSINPSNYNLIGLGSPFTVENLSGTDYFQENPVGSWNLSSHLMLLAFKDFTGIVKLYYFRIKDGLNGLDFKKSVDLPAPGYNNGLLNGEVGQGGYFQLAYNDNDWNNYVSTYYFNGETDSLELKRKTSLGKSSSLYANAIPHDLSHIFLFNYSGANWRASYIYYDKETNSHIQKHSPAFDYPSTGQSYAVFPLDKERALFKRRDGRSGENKEYLRILNFSESEISFEDEIEHLSVENTNNGSNLAFKMGQGLIIMRQFTYSGGSQPLFRYMPIVNGLLSKAIINTQTSLIGYSNREADTGDLRKLRESGRMKIPDITRGIYGIDHKGDLDKLSVAYRFFGICFKDGELIKPFTRLRMQNYDSYKDDSQVKIKVPPGYFFIPNQIVAMEEDGSFRALTSTSALSRSLLLGIVNMKNQICFKGECNGFEGLIPGRRCGFKLEDGVLLMSHDTLNNFGVTPIRPDTLYIKDFIFNETNFKY